MTAIPTIRRARALALLLCGALGVGRAAHAQPAAPSAADVEARAAARVADAVCDRRVVLLGELPDHGHARGFGVKARIVQRLVSRCGFDAVLFEAGSYDFFGLERAIAAAPRDTGAARTDSLDLALARAIGGFWWTRELAPWRRWLLGEVVAGRVAVGGMDDQVNATAAYASASLPALVAAGVPPGRSAECRAAVTRYLGWSYDATARYDAAERARLAECTRLASERGGGARRPDGRSPDAVMLADYASHFAREGGVPGAADRDRVMAEHVAWWAARLPRDARIVVWTATSHATRAADAQLANALGGPPLGARLAERWGGRLGVVGFTALRGDWSRAGAPSRPMPPVPADALEPKALAGATPGDTAAWAYLDRAALRALGPVPSRLFGRVVTTDWSAAFDGVVVLRDESAPTFVPRR
ncbi:erythromycin esterase family protein [Roseisolibacter sp. H3M3-2]|uniref:erythromycin esterase family protein n=1 Tax=Roseisolibacter sp. H3M3-2 TaxID=3031323 RepID=UPI0023DB85DF|nr:erythromycin esterase family protein [Roseisolibacter sp. H3M3-2]MDF1505030.1 erythromycin esterase family protein [Roseisolibacter sp. H3M3-2]